MARPRARLLFSPAELALRRLVPEAADDSAAGAEYARRASMARLCVAPGCRAQALLAAFGEESGPCGHCDHCHGPLRFLRRFEARVAGWRLAVAQRLHATGAVAESPPISDAAAEEVLDAPIVPPAGAVLTVRDARLLRALTEERARVARRLRRAPRQVATDDLLMRLAVERPSRPDDPLLTALPGAAAFLRRIAEAD